MPSGAQLAVRQAAAHAVLRVLRPGGAAARARHAVRAVHAVRRPMVVRPRPARGRGSARQGREASLVPRVPPGRRVLGRRATRESRVKGRLGRPEWLQGQKGRQRSRGGLMRGAVESGCAGRPTRAVHSQLLLFEQPAPSFRAALPQLRHGFRTASSRLPYCSPAAEAAPCSCRRPGARPPPCRPSRPAAGAAAGASAAAPAWGGRGQATPISEEAGAYDKGLR
jgi:hypothetical protein